MDAKLLPAITTSQVLFAASIADIGVIKGIFHWYGAVIWGDAAAVKFSFATGAHPRS